MAAPELPTVAFEGAAGRKKDLLRKAKDPAGCQSRLAPSLTTVPESETLGEFMTTGIPLNTGDRELMRTVTLWETDPALITAETDCE